MQKNNAEDIRLEVRETFEMDTLSIRSTTQTNSTNLRNQKQEIDQFVLGMEFYKWKNRNDSRHKIFVQLNSYELSNVRENESVVDRETDDRRFQEISNYHTISTQKIEVTDAVNPLQLRYEGYKNKSLNWLGTDYIFVNANAVYSFGDADKTAIAMRETVTISNDDISESEDITQKEVFDAEDKLYLGRLSVGYLISKTGENYSFFTGINPFYEYSKMNTSSVNMRKTYSNSYNHDSGLIVPFYTSFSITENLKIWGGSNLSAHFNFNKRKDRVYPDPENLNPLGYIVPIENEYTRKEISTDQKLYLGLRFDHKSGLSAITNFRGNLSNVQNWFLTVRYTY